VATWICIKLAMLITLGSDVDRHGTFPIRLTMESASLGAYLHQMSLTTGLTTYATQKDRCPEEDIASCLGSLQIADKRVLQGDVRRDSGRQSFMKLRHELCRNEVKQGPERADHRGRTSVEKRCLKAEHVVAGKLGEPTVIQCALAGVASTQDNEFSVET
jgi:hypothetical protein